MQAYLDLQLEPVFVAPHCASVLSAWVVKLHVCQFMRTVSSVLEACKVQLGGPLPSSATHLHNSKTRKHNT